MVVEIIFVRHGETDYNVEGKLQGQMDLPLNENGLKEAEELSEALSQIEFDIIISSSLRRLSTGTTRPEESSISSARKCSEKQTPSPVNPPMPMRSTGSSISSVS